RPEYHAGSLFKPCPVCTPMEGKPWWEWGTLIPGDAHPNCILPGNSIIAPGRLIAGSQAFYDGTAIEISLADGTEFSVTENHPVLTTSGWLPARFLQVGDDLHRAVDRQRVATFFHPNNDQMPALIEDVFRTLKESSDVPPRSMEVAPEDFHGDAI